jgi:ABC-2 type transport system ATP-binding protein
MIFLEHVTKLYGPVIGVNDLTLSLPRGAYGLIGPNGSGKSTLLNLVTGQLRPTLGTVRVLDRNPCNNAGVLRHLGVCPEQDLLYANVSALDWVTYLLRLHDFGRREAKLRAEQALDQVGMSGAMRRRTWAPLDNTPLAERSRSQRGRSQPPILRSLRLRSGSGRGDGGVR